MASVLHAQRPVKVRTANIEDAASVSEMITHTFIHTYAHSLTKQQLDSYLDQGYRPAVVAQNIQDPQRDLLVATDAREVVVGLAMLTRESQLPEIDHVDNAVELQRLYIHPECQGCGIGRLLVDEVERTAKQQGFQHVWLSVWEENVKAQKVYERLGFTKVGEQPFDVGGAIQKDHIMLKRL